MIVTTTNSRYTIKAVKPLFSPLISDEIPALPYVEERNPTGCGEASETSIGVGAKNKFVILKRGSCNFIEKVGAGPYLGASTACCSYLLLSGGFFALTLPQRSYYDSTNLNILKSQLWNAQAAGAAGVVLINTEDNINLLPGAPDDVARPEIPMMIISSSDGSRLLRDVGKVTVMTFFEDNLQLVDLYQHSNLYASDASGIFFSVVLKDVVYAPYQAFYGATEVGGLRGAYLHGAHVGRAACARFSYDPIISPRLVVTPRPHATDCRCLQGEQSARHVLGQLRGRFTAAHGGDVQQGLVLAALASARRCHLPAQRRRELQPALVAGVLAGPARAATSPV